MHWRRVTTQLFAVVLALALSGCVSAEALRVSMFSKGKAAPSFETVVDFIKLDDERGARLWLIRKGVTDSDIEELIIKARVRVKQLRDECLGKTDCSGI